MLNSKYTLEITILYHILWMITIQLGEKLTKLNYI